MHKLKLKKKEMIFTPFIASERICHASNVCVLDNGNILAAWFAGSKEGADDVSIWYSIRKSDGWCNPIAIENKYGAPCWNPVFYQLDSGRIILFFKVGKEISKWQTMVMFSDDDGHQWSVPVELVPGDFGGRGPVRCKAIKLSDNSIIAGNSTEKGKWKAYADRSENNGITWIQSEPIEISVNYEGGNIAEDSEIEVSEQSFYGRGVIQPSIWESANGEVHMLMRSSESKIYRADSEDYGITWSNAYATELPNNNSGIDVVRSKSNLLVLCSNPVAKAWGPRSPLTLQISEDNGFSWQESLVIESEPGEFSYPSIVSKNNCLYLTYTYDRKTIAYCEIEILEEVNE